MGKYVAADIVVADIATLLVVLNMNLLYGLWYIFLDNILKTLINCN